MNHATHCKFCQKPITVTIDDAYAALGDPYKLIPMACCDACAAIRVHRRRLEGALATVCRNIQLLGKKDEQSRANYRTILTKLTQDYARMIARWHHLDGCAWDEECVNLLMDKPHAWGQIITQLWSLFKDWEKERRVA